jgi:hypothetical protein
LHEQSDRIPPSTPAGRTGAQDAVPHAHRVLAAPHATRETLSVDDRARSKIILVKIRPTVLAAALLAACTEPAPPPSPPSPPAGASSLASASPPSPPSPPSFPAIPATPEDAAALIARDTLRPIAPLHPVDAPAILAAITANPAALVAGDGPVARWIQAFLERAGGEDA